MPPSRQLPGHAAVVEDDLGRVAGADAVLLELLALADAGRAGRDDEGRVAAGAELRLDGEHEDVHVGDAAVGDPGLRAVEHPFVLGLVVDGAGLERADVGAGVRLADAEGAELDLVRRAEALRDPLDDLLGRAVGDDAGHAERRAHDRRARCRRRPRTAPRSTTGIVSPVGSAKPFWRNSHE